MSIILDKTDMLRLEHEFESVKLIEIKTGKSLLEDFFYGNPTCGLIDLNNNWVVVAGQHITIWTPKEVNKVESEELKDIHSLKVKNQNTIELLTDPWAKDSAIWEMCLLSLKTRKIKDFPKYRNKTYSENIQW